MQPAMVTTVGKSIEPVTPQMGLLYPAMQLDARQGATPIALGPRGDIATTGSEDKHTLLIGESPCIYWSREMASKGATGDRMSVVDTCAAYVDAITNLPFFSDIEMIARPKESMAASVKPFDLLSYEKMLVAESHENVYVMFRANDYYDWLDEVINLRETMIRRPAMAEATPVGLAAYLENDKGKRYLVRPKNFVSVKDAWMDMEATESKLSVAMMKNIAVWQCVGAHALRNLVAAMASSADSGLTLMNADLNDPNGNDEAAVLYGAVAVLPGFYAGWNGQLVNDVKYTAEGFYDRVFKYLPLPFSQSLPQIGYQKGMDIKKVIAATMVFNAWLALSAELYGAGQTCPIRYTQRRGNVFVIKQQLERTLQPQLNLGGQSMPWMAPPTFNSILNGIFLPCVISKAKTAKDGEASRWDQPNTYPNEKFSEVLCDRGRVKLPEVTGSSPAQNVRVVITRDSFLDTFTYQGAQWVRMVQPIARDAGNVIPGSPGWIAGSESMPSVTPLVALMSYMFAAKATPRAGVYCDPGFFDVAYNYSFYNGESIVETTMGARVPLPGELMPAATHNANLPSGANGAGVQIATQTTPTPLGGIAPHVTEAK